MLSSYYTLSHVASSLSRQLRGHHIRSVFTQEKGQLIIHTDRDHHVIVSCLPGLNALYLHRKFTRAKKNTLGLFQSCNEKEVVDVRMHPNDRIVTFHLEGGEYLQASFFGSAANVLYIGADGNVIDSFKQKKSVEDQIVKPRVKAETAEGNESVSSRLKLKLLHPGPELIREISFRTSIPGSIKWLDLTADQRDLIDAAAKDLMHELHNVSPRIYTTGDGTLVLSLISLRQYADCPEELFEDLNDAIRMFIGKSASVRKREGRRDSLEKRLTALLEKAERTADAMEHDISSSGRPEEYEDYGKLLLANIAQMQKGMNEIVVDDDGVKRTIALDRALKPAANAQRYFDKAKRSRSARKEAGDRLASVHERIGVIHRLRSALDASESLDKFQTENASDLEIFGLSDKVAAAPQPPFRIYQVHGGFEVWAGKNSRSNDELTMKHARPNDLWFHARGAGGSHVVLRTNSAKGEPGKRALMQAAGIAAWFSKLKGSKLVPVAMTRRKHVRKPRGAPPGTVLIEREEVIIAAPVLPETKFQNKAKSKHETKD